MTFLSLRIKDSVVAQSLFMKNKKYDYTYRGSGLDNRRSTVGGSSVLSLNLFCVGSTFISRLLQKYISSYEWANIGQYLPEREFLWNSSLNVCLWQCHANSWIMHLHEIHLLIDPISHKFKLKQRFSHTLCSFLTQFFTLIYVELSSD